MVQAEILKFINKCKKPVTARQISEALDIAYVCVTRALKSMMKYKEIAYYEMSYEEAKVYLDYQINRRIYVYFPLDFDFVFSYNNQSSLPIHEVQ